MNKERVSRRGGSGVDVGHPVWGTGIGALVANTFHLRTSYGKLRGERIKQVNKIEKLIVRIKGLRWRQVTLLGFVLVVDLLDLPTVDA